MIGTEHPREGKNAEVILPIIMTLLVQHIAAAQEAQRQLTIALDDLARIRAHLGVPDEGTPATE